MQSIICLHFFDIINPSVCRMNRYFILLLITSLEFAALSFSVNQKALLTLEPSSFDIVLSQPPQERYKQVIHDKKELLNQFIDHLYQIPKFKYSMWVAKLIFYIFPSNLISAYLGEQFFEQCIGIAKQSQRKVHQIIVYNYMYQIGASKDFCTSIAVTQKINSTFEHKQSLSLLARNLDYGFQNFLAKNTIKLNFYKNKNDSNILFTTLTHAGFISSHTVLKYQNAMNFQFALALNERHSESFVETMARIIFGRCESVFQITNKILKTDINNFQELIELISSSRSCSRFYFTIHTRNGQNILIQKEQGVGSHKVYLQRYGQRGLNEPFYILQTNSDMDKSDPDGRRDQAVSKIDQTIMMKGYIQKKDVKRILLQAPNFNNKTLMTAIIDVEKGQIQTMVWQEYGSTTAEYSNK